MPVIVYSQSSEQKLLDEIAKYRSNNNQSLAAGALNKLAFLYWQEEKHEKAIQAFEQSIALNIEVGNENAVKAIYSNIGMINSDIGQPETALVFFRKSLLISEKQKNKQDIGTNLINISVALSNLKRPNESIENLIKALTILTELNNKKLLRTCYGMMADAYEEIGDSQKSKEYFTLYIAFQKEIQEIEIEQQRHENDKKVAEVEKKVQKAIVEKKITEEKLVVTQDSLKIAEELNQINQLKIQKQQVEIKNQRLLTLIFIIGMGFVVIVALFILRSYQQKKRHNEVLERRNEEIRKQNEEIKAKNHKINQSINYAKNIQGALLPEIAGFNNLFKEAFIFFSPRDVVSGDFYWYDKIKCKDVDLKIVAAVDCTGHGVPGAFMSMLGMSFLEEIVLEKKIISPDLVLEDLHNLIRTSLKQDISGNTDGMDMAICVIDEVKKELKFAGAVNSLVYMQEGEMNVLKGDFFGVGGQMKMSLKEETTFSLQTLDISKPTTCYMFSDGFPDQFGGEKGRKYFLKNFRSLLFDIYEKPMHEQNEILNSKLLEWHGDDFSRIDDVLIMGFRL